MQEGLHARLFFLCVREANNLAPRVLSRFEKEPWLQLVTWKCVSVNCAAGVGSDASPLNFVDWTIKYYLRQGENYRFIMALEFLSCVQTALLSASYDNALIVRSRLSSRLLLQLISRLSHGLHKSFEKVSCSASGLPQIFSATERKINFAPAKYFCSVSGPRSRQFDIVYMRSQHYAMLHFSGVVDIFKYPRHQLIIGCLSNDDGDVNKNLHHAFSYISVPAARL